MNIFNIVDGTNLSEKFVIVDGSIEMLEYDYLNELSLRYDESGMEEGCVLISEETVDKAYLFRDDGYRGVACYYGLMKVNGKWYDCDIVGEGVAYETDLTDNQVEEIVKSVE